MMPYSRAEPRWRFQINVGGTVFKTYVIVGMEWFNIYKHTAAISRE